MPVIGASEPLIRVSQRRSTARKQPYRHGDYTHPLWRIQRNNIDGAWSLGPDHGAAGVSNETEQSASLPSPALERQALQITQGRAGGLPILHRLFRSQAGDSRPRDDASVQHAGDVQTRDSLPAPIEPASEFPIQPLGLPPEMPGSFAPAESVRNGGWASDESSDSSLPVARSTVYAGRAGSGDPHLAEGGSSPSILEPRFGGPESKFEHNDQIVEPSARSFPSSLVHSLRRLVRRPDEVMPPAMSRSAESLIDSISPADAGGSRARGGSGVREQGTGSRLDRQSTDLEGDVVALGPTQMHLQTEPLTVRRRFGQAAGDITEPQSPLALDGADEESPVVAESSTRMPFTGAGSMESVGDQSGTGQSSRPPEPGTLSPIDAPAGAGLLSDSGPRSHALRVSRVPRRGVAHAGGIESRTATSRRAVGPRRETSPLFRADPSQSLAVLARRAVRSEGPAGMATLEVSRPAIEAMRDTSLAGGGLQIAREPMTAARPPTLSAQREASEAIRAIDSGMFDSATQAEADTADSADVTDLTRGVTEEESAGPDAGSEISLELLARKVYDRLRTRLLVDRERGGLGMGLIGR